MSAQYDLYETPDIKQTGEKQPFIPALFPKGLSVRTISRPRTQIYRNQP